MQRPATVTPTPTLAEPTEKEMAQVEQLPANYRARMTHRQLDDSLPPLAPPGASDEERDKAIIARMVARHGAPSLDDYRRVYEACGLDWPGDEEIRRRHPVAADPAA